jgi:hypothetical protein
MMDENEKKRFDKLGKEIKELYITPLVNKDTANTNDAIKQQEEMLSTINSIKENIEEYKNLILQKKEAKVPK